MSFQHRLTRCPIPYDPVAGAEAAALFPAQPAPIRDLLTGVAGCSPYLRGLMVREADWLTTALRLSPETALQQGLVTLQALPLDQLSGALRQTKRRTALLVALADLGGIWALESVTAALTTLADTAVDLCLKRLVAEEIRRGKLPGTVAQDAETAAGMVALAMGKMGAAELNYSSDIDLILLYDDTRYAAADQPEARAAFIRVARKMTALLSDNTDQGYVFRTDLRLRPDASVTPVCLSMAAAEGYYESVGRTWERAAYIKARPCGGDIAAGEGFLKTLIPFVWRKHLDFNAIQDAHDMRLRIRDHKGLGGPITLEGHNMKLGPGGIREIEFFTQTRQIIAGGRDMALRSRQTLPALQALSAKGWVPRDVAQQMTTLYRAHREVEHRLQMINDAQTHDLPTTPEGFDRLARFMGQADTTAFRAMLLDNLYQTAGLTEGFFAPGPAGDAPKLSPTATAIVEGWRGYPALRSARASEVFKRLRPQILTRLTRSADPEAALNQFDAFLQGLPAGAQLFALFDANPQLIDLIVDIAATAPNLARYLARNAGVLDAVLGGAFFAAWPGAVPLQALLADHLATVPDYERKLDAARRWTKEWHFRIGVHHLRGLIDAFEAGAQYADLATAAVAAIWQPCVDEFARKHGSPPGRGAVIVAMGSLGAGRLNAASDLDLIVIYDPQDAEMSEAPTGAPRNTPPRLLATRPYYARLTQALVTAVSAQLPEGRLYEVDMRLRPSGRQGPVATALAAFRAYQTDEAWTWEHLALTRARVIAGDTGLALDVEAFRSRLLTQKGQGAGVLRDVADMRDRIRAARSLETSAWEVKLGPGRLQDIELIAQTAALRAGDPARRVEPQLRAGVRSGWLSPPEARMLLASYQLCWRVQCSARLLAERTLDPETIGSGGVAFVLRETGVGSMAALSADLAVCCTNAAAVIGAALARDTAGAEQGDADGQG